MTSIRTKHDERAYEDCGDNENVFDENLHA